MLYYKYRNIQDGIDILQTSSLWFSSPKGFEDKFDCQPGFSLVNPMISNPQDAVTAITRLLNSKDFDEQRLVLYYNKSFLQDIIKKISKGEINPKTFIENILNEHIQNDLRILSLTSTPDNILMWKKYTQNGNGLVLGFKKISTIKTLPMPVLYTNKRDLKVRASGIFFDYLALTPLARKNIYYIFTHKLKQFEYENEYRYILFEQNIKIENKNYSINNKGILYHFSDYDLLEIYLGFNMNILDKLYIYNIVHKKFRNTKIYQTYYLENKIFCT